MTDILHSPSVPGGDEAGGAHTPGPWIEIETESSVDHEWADGGRIGGWQDIGPAEGEAVAVVLFRNGSDHFNADLRGEANARLIAAAPELLEAGQALQSARKAQKLAPSAENLSRVRLASDAFDEAIAKATAGETRNAERAL